MWGWTVFFLLALIRMTLELSRTLRALLIEYGVEEVNMAWVNLLTTLESQLKEVLHPEVKPKTPEIVYVNTIESVSLPAPKKVVKKLPDVIELGPTGPVLPEKVVPEKKMADLNKRKIHKEAVAKQKEKLDAQGINGRQLLTADAMKKWIDNGKTYWDIAEQTGVPDADISVVAKSFGLQSKVSKLIGLKK